jgi:CubicO group peptidase (beta-lactamase class C family)
MRNIKSFLWPFLGLLTLTFLFSFRISTEKIMPEANRFSVESSDSVVLNSERVKGLMKTYNIPTLGLGFIIDGELKEMKVFGELQGQPAPPNTLFNLASITKTVTTLVALRLVNVGKWDLDEPIFHYWIDPDVKDDIRSRKLTTRHILSHQTGFPNWRWQTLSKKLTFEFDPGTRFQYSGEGFEYLRQALENKFHRSLEQLADSLIFKPLQMQNTSFLWNDQMLSHFAFPHNSKGEKMEFNKNTTPNAADMLRTTVADYCNFMLSVMKSNGLSEQLFKQMISPQVKITENKYMGLGWAIYTNLGDGEYALSHSGSDPGVNTIAFLLPESKRGLLIFTNSDNGPQIYTTIIKAYLKDQGQAIYDIEMKNQN